MNLIFVIFPFVTSLNYPKEFINIDAKRISPILHQLHSYSVSQFTKTKCSTKEMFISYCRNIREAKYYLHQKSNTNTYNNIIFLGWLPLMNDKRLIKFRDFVKTLKTNNKANPYLKVPLRNDNNGIPYKKVPYLFIFVENTDSNVFKIEKILINPTIDLEIDIQDLKTDLEDLCCLSNVTLDTTNLSNFDSGRWHLILSESKIL